MGRSRALIPAATACGLLWIAAVWLLASDVQPSALIPLGIVGLVTTVSLLLLLQHQHTRLHDLVATDPLTGLVNHRAFHETLAFELQRGRELQRPVALVSLDLDNFTAINDAHGHPYGDQVLSAVGGALRKAVRANDTAARVGGEQFSLILPGSDAEMAFAVAERARENVAEIAVHGFNLTCSAGLAAFPADAEDPGALSQLADGALFWAKRDGKRRTRRFDPGHSPATWSDRQRAEIAALLGREKPIACVFQPVVSLASGRVVGYEALARFPGSSMRTPDIWFAQAHGCGLGPELEAAAIRAAMEPLGRPLDAHLAINVGPSALSTETVQRTLRGNLEGIVVEITEHEFVPDDD